MVKEDCLSGLIRLKKEKKEHLHRILHLAERSQLALRRGDFEALDQILTARQQEIETVKKLDRCYLKEREQLKEASASQEGRIELHELEAVICEEYDLLKQITDREEEGIYRLRTTLKRLGEGLERVEAGHRELKRSSKQEEER